MRSDHDDYKSIMVKAVADRLAEALAERIHEEVGDGCTQRPVFAGCVQSRDD